MVSGTQCTITVRCDHACSSAVLREIGDDAAVVSTPSSQMLLTTDAIVDGVHFKSRDERWYDIGWKCAVSNISDIAAMGGTPDHALVTLGVPPEASIDTYIEFYSGMNKAFEKASDLMPLAYKSKVFFELENEKIWTRKSSV